MTQAFNLSQLANNVDSSGLLDASAGLANAVGLANGGTGSTTPTNAKVALEVITGATASNIIAAGTTAQRDASPNYGYQRANITTGTMEWWNGSAWVGLGGASGSAGNGFVYENDTTVTADYTITAGKNAMSAGPITINTGVSVVIPTGSAWVIV